MRCYRHGIRAELGPDGLHHCPVCAGLRVYHEGYSEEARCSACGGPGVKRGEAWTCPKCGGGR